MIQYRCLYKCERCNQIFCADVLDFEEEIEPDRIIINRYTNEVKYLTRDGFWVDIGYFESVSHECKHFQNKVTAIGVAKFIGIELADKPE